MKQSRSIASLALAVVAGNSFMFAQTGEEAVLLRVDDNLQQARVEAYDAGEARWLAIASGYRDAVDNGWLKIALPPGYEQAQLRVMGSAQVSPFHGKISNAAAPDDLYVAYPPSSVRNYLLEDAATGGAKSDTEAVIEEADIWAWDGTVLYFYNQYRGLQVLDMADPAQPLWLDYFRYPAKGEDLYSVGGGRVVLIGTGYYWQGDKLTLQFLDFDGSQLSLTDSVELPSGYYMDSRRYNDFLYVMTREWVSELDLDGRAINAPRIHLYTIALKDDAPERIVDKKTFDGDGWLDAVLTAQPDGILLSLNKWYNGFMERRYRWRSEVHVLVPGTDGVPNEAGVARVSGIIQDKFKLNFENGILTTIAQQADWMTGQFSRATKLENFQLGETGFTKVGALDLAPGESLFASRFYGDNVYIVTFLFVDPLFSVDNSDPTHPFVAGELEVPGWSNYIEWVDGQLFAVGIENSRLTVSIFDVADPANMSLKDRVFLNEDSWSYSEAQYDDQAISFFPDAGLLMLPFTTWSWKSSGMIQAMQLVSWDDTGLQLRGQIQHLDVPRRGVLIGDTVYTISGREVVTTDVADPDSPAETGSATLAWNVRHLIPHADYWLELESMESGYGYHIWRYPYNHDSQTRPVLYVTSRAEPNVPVAGVELQEGAILGVAHAGERLVLLQDVSVDPDADTWTIPERQSVAVRVYDMADPLAPVLTGEALLGGVPYMGSRFSSEVLADGTILWHSSATPFYGIYFYDIWPGPWYYQSALSYLVSTVSPGGVPEIPAHDVFPVKDYWNQASSWFWEDPVLAASMTTYVEHQRPDITENYKASTVLLALDFTDPASPAKLPRVRLPANLVAINSLQDGINHFLYFEPAYSVLEVWGWDKAAAFPLFRQKIPQESTDTSSYTLAWMAPFNLRNHYAYRNGLSTNRLDAWYHVAQDNLFRKAAEFTLQDRWISNHAVMEPEFLLSTYDQVMVFKGDAASGAFDLVHQAGLPFPNIYSLQLDQSVIADDALYIPAGMYGVETVPLPAVQPQATAFTAGVPGDEVGWFELGASLWQRVTKGATDEAGAMERLQWLFHADSMREPDPQATDAGDLWRDSAWFGWYVHLAGYPAWIHHLEHGNLWTSVPGDAGASGFHLYDDELGYLWTHTSYYPFLYSFDRGQWLYYLKGSGLGGKRWFYDYASGWFDLVK